MPPLIVAVFVGAGVLAGIRVARRILATHVDASTTRSDEMQPAIEKDLGHLELDPATGIYRPATPQI